jgi:hypothetical protein
MTKTEQYKAVRLNGLETAEALDREAKHIGSRRRRTNFLPSTTLEEIFEIVIVIQPASRYLLLRALSFYDALLDAFTFSATMCKYSCIWYTGVSG